MSSLERVKEFLKSLEDKDIIFKDHFYEKAVERPINESLVREYLKNPESLVNAEERPSRDNAEQKYKLWFRMSNKYSLVVIVAISGKNLYIITAWNTDRKWQRSIQK